MGFRFQRSAKLLPGVRLNFSKSGIGASFGVKGARYSISPTGRRTASVGIPGTGMSWRSSAGAARLGATMGSDSSYEGRVTQPKGVGCFSIGFAVLGTFGVIGAFTNTPFNGTSLLIWLAVAIAAWSVIITRTRTRSKFKPIEDHRLPEGADIASDADDIPATLAGIIEEQALYEPMWEAYKRAKAGQGGGLAHGIPLDGDEVSIYELPGEFFDPSRGLNGVPGTVIVTSKRIIFDSVERGHEWLFAKFSKIAATGPGQRVFTVKGRSKNYGLLFAEHVNDFDNAMGLALWLANPKFTPGGPQEAWFEES